ncbi:MAG: gliding motility-associated C-terminal domain-containing protein [Bacteroidales bacterium]
MIKSIASLFLFFLIIISGDSASGSLARSSTALSAQAGQPPEFTTRIPNAFMPLSHIPRNRVFRAFFNTPPQNYSLTIYNNWGSEIFKTTNPDSAWDGTYENMEAPAGGYIYRITYTDPQGENHEVNGIVMLIR